MKSQNVIFTILMGSIILSCDQDNEQLGVLQAEISMLTSNYEEQLAETRHAVARGDSLQTLVHDMEQEIMETKFLYTEVKGDVFVTSYRTTLRVYENNQQKLTNSLVVQLAGEREDGWKAGHYNWVSFNY